MQCHRFLLHTRYGGQLKLRRDVTAGLRDRGYPRNTEVRQQYYISSTDVFWRLPPCKVHETVECWKAAGGLFFLWDGWAFLTLCSSFQTGVCAVSADCYTRRCPSGKPRLECVDGRHPPSKPPVGVLPCTCRSEGK